MERVLKNIGVGGGLLFALFFFFSADSAHAAAPPCGRPQPGHKFAVVGIESPNVSNGDYCIEIPESQTFLTFDDLVESSAAQDHWVANDDSEKQLQNCSDLSTTAEAVGRWTVASSYDDFETVRFDIDAIERGVNCGSAQPNASLFRRYVLSYSLQRRGNGDLTAVIYPKGIYQAEPIRLSGAPSSPIALEFKETSASIRIEVSAGPAGVYTAFSPTQEERDQVYAGLDIACDDAECRSATIIWNTAEGNVLQGRHDIVIRFEHGETGSFKDVTLSFNVKVTCENIVASLTCSETPEQCRTTCNANEACIFLLDRKDNISKCQNKLDLGGASAIQADISERYQTPAGYGGALPPCAFDGTCRDINDLLGVVVRYGQMIFGIVAMFAFIFFVYGGFVMITSFGYPQRVTEGRNILLAAVTGLLITFISYLVIQFILDALQVSPEFRAIPRAPRIFGD